MLTKKSAIGSMAVMMALGAIASEHDVNVVEKKEGKNSKSKHPFEGNQNELYVYLLEDCAINADDIRNLNKNLFIPVEMIPIKEAGYIVDYVNSNRKESYKNMNVFEADVDYNGKMHLVKTIATNQKNAHRKMISKIDAVEEFRK